MRVNAEFVTSVARFDDLPGENLPEIALVGRSNVGKSSLINTLTGRSGLARTSKTPGRTQTLNYYKITPDGTTGRSFFFVDMPGYGFAAVSKAGRAQWQELIEQYLNQRAVLRGVMHIIDLRHAPQQLDHVMAEWLQSNRLNHLIIGTKADKLPVTKVPQALTQITESLNADSKNTIAFSAQTGLGRDQLWRWVISSANNEERHVRK